MNIFDKIDMLGDPVEQHHFTGAFDGAAVALYAIDSEEGTHFAATFEASGPIQVMSITSEANARKAYQQVIERLS